MKKHCLSAAGCLLTGLSLFAGASFAQATTNVFKQYNIHDLSHLVPVYEPLNGDATQSDISKPVGNSQPVAGSGGKLGVRNAKPTLKTENGYVQWGYLYLDEHYSTHVDSTHHFVTTNKSLQTVAEPDERGVGEFTLEELIGPIVYIDISDRVSKELAKNGVQRFIGSDDVMSRIDMGAVMFVKV